MMTTTTRLINASTRRSAPSLFSAASFSRTAPTRPTPKTSRIAVIKLEAQRGKGLRKKRDWHGLLVDSSESHDTPAIDFAWYPQRERPTEGIRTTFSPYRPCARALFVCVENFLSAMEGKALASNYILRAQFTHIRSRLL